MPVYEGDLDNIVGIVNTKDLFYLFSLRAWWSWRTPCTRALFLEPDEPVANALRLFRKSHRPMAVVRDEDGKGPRPDHAGGRPGGDRRRHRGRDGRAESLREQSVQLFEEHWLAWWTPVAAAVGLPPPHRPGRRVRDRIGRVGGTGRRRRRRDWPYTITAGDTTIHLAEYGLSFVFGGGFPEMVRIHNFEAPEGEPPLEHHWGDHIPLARLVFESYLDAAEWAAHRRTAPRGSAIWRSNGRCPTRRNSLRSLNLANVTRLAVNPARSDPDAIRPFIARPTWNSLRTLHFTGRLGAGGRLRGRDRLHARAPGGTRTRHRQPRVSWATRCSRPPGRSSARSPGRWPVPWKSASAGPRSAPAEALAAAGWIRRLRILRVTTGRGSGTSHPDQ